MSYLETYKNRFDLTYGTACTKTSAEEQKQFLLFLKNYPNTFSITHNTNTFQAGIISEKDSILQDTYYLLLTELANTIERGTLITDRINTQWLVLSNAKNGISAYNRYKVLLCDKTIKWIDDYGNSCSSACYIQGTEKGNATLSLAGSLVKVPEPNGTLLVVMPQENFRRGKRFIIEDQAWKITGYDSVSFPGVCFLSLLEDIVNEQSDNLSTDIALNNTDVYTIETAVPTYNAIVGEVKDIHYQVFKNGAPITAPCIVTSSNNKATVVGNTVTFVTIGSAIITVTLASNSTVKATSAVTIAATRVTDNDYGVLIGADTIKWGRTQTYTPTLYKNAIPQVTTFTATVTDADNLVTWSKIGSLINITANTTNKLGTVTLTIEFANHVSVSKTIDIISLWG